MAAECQRSWAIFPCSTSPLTIGQVGDDLLEVSHALADGSVFVVVVVRMQVDGFAIHGLMR